MISEDTDFPKTPGKLHKAHGKRILVLLSVYDNLSLPYSIYLFFKKIPYN